MGWDEPLPLRVVVWTNWGTVACNVPSERIKSVVSSEGDGLETQWAEHGLCSRHCWVLKEYMIPLVLAATLKSTNNYPCLEVRKQKLRR